MVDQVDTSSSLLALRDDVRRLLAIADELGQADTAISLDAAFVAIDKAIVAEGGTSQSCLPPRSAMGVL